MTPGSAPDPGHESNDARGAKRVRGLAPPPYRGGSELDVIFEPHSLIGDRIARSAPRADSTLLPDA